MDSGKMCSLLHTSMMLLQQSFATTTTSKCWCWIFNRRAQVPESWLLVIGAMRAYIYTLKIFDCTSLTVTFACGGCYKHLEEAESAVGSWGLRVCWVHSGHQAHLKKSRFSPSHKSLLEMMLFLIESVKAINLKISSNYFVQDVNEVIYYRWIIL